MAKELPFFKFDISEWMLGRIQKHSESTQGMFMNLCCKYWHKLGEYTFTDACDDFDEKRISALIKAKIIGHDGEFIFIKFLDKQLEECEETSKKNSIKGLKSAEIRAKRKQQLTAVEPQLKTVQPNSTEEKREEERIIRGEEKREDTLPLLGIDLSVEKILKDEMWIHNIRHLTKNKNLEGAARSAFLFIETKPERFKVSDLNDLKRTTISWLENDKPITNGNTRNGVNQLERIKSLRKS